MFSNDITIQQLIYFYKIADYKNFSKAAEQLYIAQPALSKSIAKLEAALGAKLFERVYHGVELTEAGWHLYNNSLPLVEELLNTFNNVQLNWGKGDKRLALCCFKQFQNKERLMDAIYRYKTQNQTHATTFDAVNADEILPAISKDLYDAYITPYFYIKNNPNMDFIVLEKRSACINIGISHPLADKKDLCLQDLKGETFCLLPPEEKASSLNSQILSRLAKNDVFPKHLVYPKNIGSRHIEVISGSVDIGIPLVNTLIKNVPILPDDQEADIVISWNKDRNSELLSKFTSLLS